jgi:hypothetical protein
MDVLPISTMTTKYSPTTTASAVDKLSVGLTDTQVLVFNKSSFKQLSYQTVEYAEENFVNNMTKSKYRNVVK